MTDHGTVIATIVPMRFSERTMQLYREGRVELPTLPKRPVDHFQRVHVEGGIQDILREVRWRVSTYFDASAMVKLLLVEEGSATRRWPLWAQAEDAYRVDRRVRGAARLASLAPGPRRTDPRLRLTRRRGSTSSGSGGAL